MNPNRTQHEIELKIYIIEAKLREIDVAFIALK